MANVRQELLEQIDECRVFFFFSFLSFNSNCKASVRTCVFQPESPPSILHIQLSFTSVNGGILYSLEMVSQALKSTGLWCGFLLLNSHHL